MNKLKCLIIDDEPLAREIMSSYIGRLDFLEEIGQCEDAIGAIDFLHDQSADLLFLDIQMPGLDGISFLKALGQSPQIIFTTAHREHAAEGFELNAIDYLVKPIPFYRFIQAIEKARMTFGHKEHPSSEKGAIFFKVDKKKIKIQFEDILIIESLKDYIKVVLEDRSFVTYQSMSGILELLPSSHFVRVHKSFIVNYHRIDSIDGNRIEIGEQIITIGRSYREEALEKVFATGTKGWK